MDAIWEVSERDLHEATLAAIARFARTSPRAVVCSFFFDCDEPRYGRMAISLDTLENNVRSAKKQEQRAVERRRKNLSGKLTWQWAKYQLRTPVLSPFNTNGGDFAFQQFAVVEFPAWRKLAKKGGYPVGAAHEDDYLESNARLVIWRVIERLVADGAFEPLTLAAPFMVGYSIHDQESAILRLLNWPAVAEPGAAADGVGV